MKKFTVPVRRCFIIIMLFAFVVNNTAIAQEKITPAAWHSDLQYFQQLIHTKYGNLFYNVTEKEFDNEVDAIDKKIGTLSDMEMRVAFTKLVAMFKVGHTAVRRQSGTGADFKAWARTIPVVFYLFDDGLYKKSIASTYKEAVGSKVIKIGNTNSEMVLQKIKPVKSPKGR